jgi:hypothetical protein
MEQVFAGTRVKPMTNDNPHGQHGQSDSAGSAKREWLSERMALLKNIRRKEEVSR